MRKESILLLTTDLFPIPRTGWAQKQQALNNFVKGMSANLVGNPIGNTGKEKMNKTRENE